MPFVCTPRITNSTEGGVSLQITDLFPHKTQSNAVLTPNFQGPTYIYAQSRSLTETVAVDGNFATTLNFSGLAVYFLTTLEDTAGIGGSITPAMANNIAQDILDRIVINQSLTESDLNTIIVARTGGANGISVGDSTVSVLEVLQIASGYKVYSVPQGQAVEVLLAFNPLNANDQAGFFSDPYDLSKMITHFESSFFISARKGQLKTAQTRKVDGSPAPFVVCYADDGSLIQ